MRCADTLLLVAAAASAVMSPAHAALPPIGTFFGVPGQARAFEYVIVGGGTSGLTVANRLAAAGHTVGVIEAGSVYELTNGNRSEIPAYATQGSTGLVTDIPPLVDWGFITAPQAGLQRRTVHYAQGKCLGGSSARNVLAYQRGTRGSFDRWAAQVGDRSFTFDNLLPYFKKSVRFTPLRDPSVRYDAAAFGDGGPLQVSYSNGRQPFTPGMQKGLSAVGLSAIGGFNSGKLIGFANVSNTIDPSTETRSSSETSFLRDSIANQKAVTTYIQTSAKKILFDGTKKAVGVQVSTGGFTYTLNATKEVIVAAGVFKTPQLLMVSGVGPQATLQQLGIPVVAALSGVGQGVIDQPFYGMGFKTNVTTDSSLADPAVLAQANADFVNRQAGPLTNTGVDLIGWEKIPAKYRSSFSAATSADLAAFPSDWPEIEILPIAAATFPVTDKSMYASITIANVAATSRGTVTINSTNTDDPPIIDPKWLTTTTDQQVAVQSIRVARDVAAASGIQVQEVAPGPAVQTDAQILSYIQQTAYTIHHACASCKMGKQGDTTAVVDTNGKVFGTTGLRLVDASTFALLPPGHCQSMVYALAEKFADAILQGY